MASPIWPRLIYSAVLYMLSPLIGWRIWREQVLTYSRLQRLGMRLGTLPLGRAFGCTVPRWGKCALPVR